MTPFSPRASMILVHSGGPDTDVVLLPLLMGGWRLDDRCGIEQPCRQPGACERMLFDALDDITPISVVGETPSSSS